MIDIYIHPLLFLGFVLFGFDDSKIGMEDYNLLIVFRFESK
jgi:hypothetical protein